MRNVVRFSLALWLVVVALAVQAGPVWKISKNGDSLLLGATVHYLKPADYPLPADLQQAYGEAQRLYLESNLDDSASPAFAQRMLAMMVNGDGRTLQQQLSPEVWQSLQRYSESRGFPLQSFQPFTPAMLTLSLTVHELQRLGFAQGVDAYYFAKAKQQGKRLAYLESSDVLLDFLADLNRENGDDLVHYTLAEIEVLEDSMTQAVASWRDGDMAALWAHFEMDEMRHRYPEIYRNLIVKRNRNWFPALERALKSPTPSLVLVGALHLSGPDSLQVMFRKAGYQVSAFNAEEAQPQQ